MISSGAMMLPRDLDIFLPFPSTTNPWVSTDLYGAIPLLPTETSSELWNQPRCWSLPSRYMLQGKASPSLSLSTAAKLEPESNQTSRISSSFTKVVLPHAQVTPRGGRKAEASFSNQTSAPCLRTASAMIPKDSLLQYGRLHC